MIVRIKLALSCVILALCLGCSPHSSIPTTNDYYPSKGEIVIVFNTHSGQDFRSVTALFEQIRKENNKRKEIDEALKYKILEQEIVDNLLKCNKVKII